MLPRPAAMPPSNPQSSTHLQLPLPKPLPSPRRRTEHYVGGTGHQFGDATIPEDDPLPDVETAALMMDLSRAQSPNPQHPFHTLNDKQPGKLPSLRQTLPALYDLTPDALRPLNSRMPGSGETVERWTKGPAPRHIKHVGREDGRKDVTRQDTVANGKDASELPIARGRENKRDYPCSQCGRIFHSRSELRHHARRYEKRPYTCDQCEKSFLYPKDLRRHKTTHTGSKQYKCRLCPKSFSRKDNLRRHINNEHEKTDIPLSPSIEAFEMTARRPRDGSEESDNGADGGNGNTYTNGTSMNNTNGAVYNSISMATDAPERSRSRSPIGDQGDGDGREAGTSRASNHGRRAHDVPFCALSINGTTKHLYESESQDDEDTDGSEDDDEPVDGGGHRSRSAFANSSEPSGAASGSVGVPNTGQNGLGSGNNKLEEDDDSDGSEDSSPFADPKPLPSPKKLVCPLRRWKPHVHKCRSTHKTIRNLIHHIKQTHKQFFHSQCVQRFSDRDTFEAHDQGQVCCRICRTGFPTRAAMMEHKGTCESNPRSQEMEWHMIYANACGDGISHKPWDGPDYPGAEAAARRRYPEEERANLNPVARRRELRQRAREMELRAKQALPAPPHEDDEEEESLVELHEESHAEMELRTLREENALLHGKVQDLMRQAQISFQESRLREVDDAKSIATLRMDNQGLRKRVQQLLEQVAKLHSSEQVQINPPPIQDQIPAQQPLGQYQPSFAWQGPYQPGHQEMTYPNRHINRYGFQTEMQTQDPVAAALPLDSANLQFMEAQMQLPEHNQQHTRYFSPFLSPQSTYSAFPHKRRIPSDMLSVPPRPSKRSLSDGRSVFSETLLDRVMDFNSPNLETRSLFSFSIPEGSLYTGAQHNLRNMGIQTGASHMGTGRQAFGRHTSLTSSLTTPTSQVPTVPTLLLGSGASASTGSDFLHTDAAGNSNVQHLVTTQTQQHRQILSTQELAETSTHSWETFGGNDTADLFVSVASNAVVDGEGVVDDATPKPTPAPGDHAQRQLLQPSPMHLKSGSDSPSSSVATVVMKERAVPFAGLGEAFPDVEGLDFASLEELHSDLLASFEL